MATPKPKAKQKLADSAALYLYGISRQAEGGRAKTPPRINSAGIDGIHAVRPLDCGEFICWVCEVDQASFAQAVEHNLENLEWLALHGVRHQQVVGEVASQMAIVPARFGTMFSGERALAQDVKSREVALKKVFDRIAGGDEWGVKVFAERSAAPAARHCGKLRQRLFTAESSPPEEAAGAQRSGASGICHGAAKDRE